MTYCKVTSIILQLFLQLQSIFFQLQTERAHSVAMDSIFALLSDNILGKINLIYRVKMIKHWNNMKFRIMISEFAQRRHKMLTYSWFYHLFNRRDRWLQGGVPTYLTSIPSRYRHQCLCHPGLIP